MTMSLLISMISTLAIVSFAALVFSAAVSDILSFTIPNRVCLAAALLYPAYVLSAPEPVDWAGGLAVGAAALGVGFLLFLSRACGAGDAKLFAVVALWAGPALILPLTIFTTLAGGVIAVFLWLQHRLARAPVPSMIFQVGADPAIGKQPMPYGAAVAVAALYVAFTLLRIN